MIRHDELFDFVKMHSSRPKTDTLLIEAMLDGRVDPANHPAGRAYLESRQGLPSTDDITLAVLSAALDAHGIASLPLPEGDYAAYVNITGEAYDTTLLCHAGEWHLTSWGDYLETKEDEYIQDMEPEALALCEALDMDPLQIEGGLGTYTSREARGEWTVYEDQDARYARDELVEELVLEGLHPGDASCTTRADLLSIDGNEHSVTRDGTTYYVYRTA